MKVTIHIKSCILAEMEGVVFGTLYTLNKKKDRVKISFFVERAAMSYSIYNIDVRFLVEMIFVELGKKCVVAGKKRGMRKI